METTIRLIAGKTSVATEKTLEFMRQDGRFFNYGGELVTITNGKRHGVDEYLLENMLDITFEKTGPRGDLRYVDPPPRMLRQILSIGERRNLRRLEAIVDRPTLSAEGEILEQPGYHAKDGIFLNFDPEDWPSIPEILDEEGAQMLLEMVWRPFREFPFTDAASRGAVLAGVITALLRGSLGTAPLFYSDAPVSGSGKTLAMETVIAIATGGPSGTTAFCPRGYESEMQKLLTSTILGNESVILFDNQEGRFHSPTLGAFLTTVSWSARLLMSNRKAENLPTKLFIAVTGTNLTFSSDMQRRSISWRIDPKSECPSDRTFSFCPKAEALKYRKGIIVGVIALVHAAQKAKLPSADVTMGSFPLWDKLVGTGVRYIEKISNGYFADPVPKTMAAMTTSEDSTHLFNLLTTLTEEFALEWFSARSIVERMQINELSGLSDALASATRRSEKLSSRSIGRYLAQFADRRCGDLVLRAETGTRILAYRVEQIRNADKIKEGVVIGSDGFVQ